MSVIGPGGIGKTRLAWEFLKYLDGLVDSRLVARRAKPRLRRRDHVLGAGRDGPRPRRARGGRRRGDDARADRRDRADTRARPGGGRLDRVGAPRAAGRRRPRSRSDQLYAAWRTFFERLAATSPVVMVFEDLHHADQGLLDFIDHLMEWSRGVPITVVTLARPELLERRPDWGAGKRSFTSIYLEPLPPAEMERLLGRPRPGPPAAGRGQHRRACRRRPAVCGRDRPDAARHRAGWCSTAGRTGPWAISTRSRSPRRSPPSSRRASTAWTRPTVISSRTPLSSARASACRASLRSPAWPRATSSRACASSSAASCSCSTSIPGHPSAASTPSSRG